MDQLNQIETSCFFQTPQFLNKDFPEEMRFIPLLLFISGIQKPKLIIDLYVTSGNFYFAFCQAIDFLKLPGRCMGFIQKDSLGYINNRYLNSLNKLIKYNLTNYIEFSSLLVIPPEEALTFIEDNSVDMLHVDLGNPKINLISYIKKLAPGGIIICQNPSHYPEIWKKLMHNYKTIELNWNKYANIGIVFKNTSERFLGSPNFDFINSNFGHQLFKHLGSILIEKSNLTESSISKTSTQELRSVIDLISINYKAHIHSWRWKLGNLLIRVIEIFLFRKKVKLASDTLKELIHELSEDIRHQNAVEKNKEEVVSFAKKYICNNSWTTTNRKIIIGFAVTSVKPETKAGDYFTAKELADACASELGWHTVFLPEDEDWYNVDHLDLLVTMKHSYDIRKVYNSKSHLIRIAWIRNRLDEWFDTETLKFYDLILSSSGKIKQYLESRGITETALFPIATNLARFSSGQFRKSFSSDYCFTGNYWGTPREIEKLLDPDKVKGRLSIFGQGWDNHEAFKEYWNGAIPYAQLPDIYASTKVVIDDATTFTETWDSVNSRVFDALGSGKIVITNGKNGANRLFKNEIPTYSTKFELTQKIQYFLDNDKIRIKQAKLLQKEVSENHTYQIRAKQLKQFIIEKFKCDQLKVAIKVPVPNLLEAEMWGDYHFAKSLGKALKKFNLDIRIDCIPDWYSHTSNDDITITLRGLSSYLPNPDHLNLQWIISHPEKVEPSELELYDHIFVASEIFTKKISGQTKTTVSTLLQCSDPTIFKPSTSKNTSIPEYQYLFVGNSRLQKRKILEDAIALQLNLKVYGNHWEGLIPEHFISGTYIPNEFLWKYYSRAKFVLNDHWESMKINGFISNRIFDAGACGSCIITDEVEGLWNTFPKGSLITYKSYSELEQKLSWLKENPKEFKKMQALIRKTILDHHTFDHRAITMMAYIEKIIEKKRISP